MGWASALVAGRTIDHPVDPVFVREHAEPRTPERLLERHFDLAAVRERVEDPLRVGCESEAMNETPGAANVECITRLPMSAGRPISPGASFQRMMSLISPPRMP